MTTSRKLEQGKGKPQCIIQTRSKLLKMMVLQGESGQGRRGIRRYAELQTSLHFLRPYFTASSL